MKQPSRGRVNWSRAAAPLLLILLAALVAAACGGDTDNPGPRHATPATATPVPVSPTPAPSAVTPTPTEFRVAFINLHSPLFLDVGSDIAASTFDERLAMIVEALRAFDPDVVGFNEWFATEDFPDVAATIGRELAMVFCHQRANPWYPTQTKEESDRLAAEAGFQEGELLLVRNTYLSDRPCERYALSPRTSESGEGRIGVHWVVHGPQSLGGGGKIDVFITHLKGGDDTIRAAQAADFARWVARQRGSGPSVVFAGQDDATSASNFETYRAIGLRDVFGADMQLTCCRTSIVGEQASMTASNDYVMYDRMQPISAELLGVEPATLPDGTVVYASDHLGIMATFRVPPDSAVSGR